MNIFIWAQSKTNSNNAVIVETIKKEHELKDDLDALEKFLDKKG